VTAAVALLLAAIGTPALAATSAVVLEYHHVSADGPESTSVDPDTFEAHMNYLATHDFHVWPLPKLVSRIRAGEDVPDRTVAITFDDAYRSVYTEAFPRLRARGWPFTVFVSPGYIDGDYSHYVSWDQLRTMARHGASIGNHSLHHPHLVHQRRDETREQWLGRVRHEIAGAQQRLEAEITQPAHLLAYPFGEFSPPVQDIARDLGLTAFGQQSGAFGPESDFTALPRYPIATAFASLDSFALKVHSRPLPVASTDPASGMLGPDARVPELRLTLAKGPYRPRTIRCYMGGEPIDVSLDDGNPPVLHVRATQPIGPGRTKYNCTAPSTDSGSWFWYSFLWMKPRADGSWYQG